MNLGNKYIKKAGSYPEKVKLSKRVVAGAVVYFFTSPAFPDYIYIALDECSVCGRGGIVNLLDETDKSFEFTPMIRIDELVLNIPPKEDYYRFFLERYGKKFEDDTPWEAREKFWDNFEWEFTTKVNKIKIEWDR